MFVNQRFVANKIVVILPAEDHPHAAVMHRLIQEVQKQNTNVVILQNKDTAIEACKDAQALIGDIDATPEVLKAVKTALPSITLVGVRECETGSNLGTAVDTSYAKLLKHRCNMLLTLFPEGHDLAARSFIQTGERGIQPQKGLEKTAAAFVTILQSRIGKRMYRSELDASGLPTSLTADAETLRKDIEALAKLSLFPKYQAKDESYPGAEFGFVAMRTPEGTLITSKTSNKTHPGIDDLALVTDIDDDHTVHVRSSKREASMNAPLAHEIFKIRPEIKYVVHSHIFLPEGTMVPTLTRPGTTEDWHAIEEAVKSGANIINQPQHGTVILLEKLEDLLPILKANGVYNHNSDLYDRIYARFQDDPYMSQVLDGIKLPENPRVLDLCCGTGLSTMAMQTTLGLSNAEFADGSASMLAVAEKRMGRKGHVATLEDLSNLPAQSYDLVTVRQAFSYVAPENLEKVAQNIARILKPGGRFVFNSFAKIAPGAAKPRDTDTEQPDLFIRTHEDNQITDTDILHTQRSEIIDFDKGRWDAVFDVNQFYQHNPEQLKSAFEKAGLTFSLQQQGNNLCYIATNRNLKQAQGQKAASNTPPETLSLQSNTIILPKETLTEMTKAKNDFDIDKPAFYPGSWGSSALREDVKRLTPNWTGEALITGSATQALMLSLQHVGRGKTLAVKVPSYFGVLRQAEELGMNVKPWQTVEELETLGAVDAVLLTSNLTPPTGQSLPDDDKKRVADFARKHDAWVIEDNAYEPLWFDKAPTPIPTDPARIIRVGSLSKTASPDFRVGFIRADNDTLEAIRNRKITAELSTPRLIQEVARAAVTEQAITRWRNTLKSRAETMQRALVKAFNVDVAMPEGGPYMALPLPENTDIDALVAQCKSNNLLIDDNRHQYPDDQNRPYLRLHFGGIREENIQQAVDTLHASFKELYRRTHGQRNSTQEQWQRFG